MSHLTFLETLKREVAQMQAAHPEREGELARAHALILHGMVVPSADDPQTGQVLSSDASTVYRVNGTCSCRAGEHGTLCKHMQAWKLYQHIAGKLEAQTTTQPLYEAPVSITMKASLHGFETLVTLRGTDFASVQAQVEQAAQWLKAQVPAPAPLAASQGQEGWCSKHGIQMKLTTKEGRSWFSHRVGETWCKGK